MNKDLDLTTVSSVHEPGDLVAVGEAMQDALAAAQSVAGAPTTVMLHGESGTGKEVLARYIHAHSPRRNGPWVAVNCAAFPGELIESELFGHERGAFTGALQRRAGHFELADGGTLLLDEISELPLSLQAKLLRVLQERMVLRVGGSQPVPVDVRIIATTNRDLSEEVRAGRFRADLYYRLDVFPIQLPPLRDRPEDLAALASHLLEQAASRLGRRAPQLTAGALTILENHAFPGNVRELANLLERALVRSGGVDISPAHLGLPSSPPAATAGRLEELPLNLDALEQLAIAEALRRTGGNRTHAAGLLGIGVRTLREKLRRGRQQGVLLDPAEHAGRRPLPGAIDRR